jgi:hypothetical protein
MAEFKMGSFNIRSEFRHHSQVIIDNQDNFIDFRFYRWGELQTKEEEEEKDEESILLHVSLSVCLFTFLPISQYALSHFLPR